MYYYAILEQKLKYEDINNIGKLLFVFTLLKITACQLPPQYDVLVAEKLLKLRNVGLAALEEDQLVQADSVFTLITKIAPKEVLGYANSALVRFRKGEASAALLRIEEAEKIAPKNADVLLLKAEFLLNMNAVTTAAAYLRKVLEIEPRNIPASYRLSKIIDAVASPAEKERLLKMVTEQVPDNFIAQLEYIKFLLASNSNKKAAEKLGLLRQIIPPGQNSVQENLHQCLIAAEEENTEKALLLLGRLDNTLKPHPAYLVSREKLEGARNAFQLTPVMHFSNILNDIIQEKELLVSTVNFEAVNTAFKFDSSDMKIRGRKDLGGKIVLTDADDNEQTDLFVLWENTHLPAQLWKNENGQFTQSVIGKKRPPECANRCICRC